MKNHRIFRTKLLTQLILDGLLLASAQAFAAEATDLGTVGTQATQSGTTAPSKAAAAAPAQASLEATEPQATVRSSFFEQAKAPTADFTNIAAVTPSVAGGISPNGPGLGESKVTLRGFQDGEYNVTYDGIPFSDTNGPTHHSTAYFPASTIDQITVERGPGNASNLGQATFGGSVNMFSPTPSSEKTLTPYAATGSWNTQLYGVRIDTGNQTELLGDGRLLLNAQDAYSDTYRTFSGVDGKNLMAKYQKALSDSTLLTVFLDYNKNHYYQPDKDNGLTLSQASSLGKNFVLTNDPTKADYYKYNRADKTTVMNYVRLESDLGSGWAIDNTSYYYNYTNNTLASDKGNDPTAGFGSVKTITGASVAGQMPGYIKINEYWVAGDIFKTTKQMSAGLLRVGLWAEKADTHRAQYDVNVLTMASSYKEANGAGGNVKFEQNSGWHQYQPFAEFAWDVTKDLTVTPGLKYMHTQLNIDASINQSSRIAQNVTKTFTATLPFLTANYKIDSTTSAYAQYAKGMLVPDISSYQSANADATNIDPQTSKNYQLGFVHKSNRLVLDADLYYIDFNNKIAQDPSSSSTNPVYYNQGGVTYKGVEGQATYAFDNGISLYGNGSINAAKSKTTGLTVKGAPKQTWAMGLLYQADGWAASLIHKYVGYQYVDDADLLKLGGYSTTDLSVGYTFLNPGWGAKNLKVNLGIYNLFDKQDIVAGKIANSNGIPSAADTFLWQPERSFMASVKVQF